MAKKQFEYHLSRRMISEQGGFIYFCRQCGVYLPEEQFYKSKESKWGLDSRCKIHHSRKENWVINQGKENTKNASVLRRRLNLHF